MRGLYSTMGDPTSFVARDNRHFELYDNITLDRGRHRVKLGAYYFHLQLRPEQSDNARGAFTYTGQFTGNAFADFLLGYPTSATSGIGRGDEDGRTNWLHAYAQDDWQARSNLTVNAGLRYEFNQHMYDIRNRLSSIDLAVPGGRVVIASDDRGAIDPGAAAMLPLIPIPYVTSKEAGWGRGLLDPSAVRLAPRLGFALALDDSRAVIRGGYGIFLNQWAYSVQTAFARNLPFFSTKQVDVPIDLRVPVVTTRDILSSAATGTVGASIMDYDYNVEYSQTWSGGLQYGLFPAMMVEVSYMGTWTLGADNATVRNVPEPGPGPIQARRPIPALSRINAIRFDGRSIYHAVTFKAERRLGTTTRTTSATRSRRRKTTRRVQGPRSPRRTSPRTSATSLTGAGSGPPPASTTGTSSSPAAPINCRFSPVRVDWPRRCSAAGAPTSSSSRSRERRSRSISALTRPISAPAPLSGPISFAIRICLVARGRRIDGSTRRRLRCRRRLPSEALRGTA